MEEPVLQHASESAAVDREPVPRGNRLQRRNRRHDPGLTRRSVYGARNARDERADGRRRICDLEPNARLDPAARGLAVDAGDEVPAPAALESTLHHALHVHVQLRLSGGEVIPARAVDHDDRVTEPPDDPPLQDSPRLAFRHAPDVHAGDPDAVGQHVRARPIERERRRATADHEDDERGHQH